MTTISFNMRMKKAEKRSTTENMTLSLSKAFITKMDISFGSLRNRTAKTTSTQNTTLEIVLGSNATTVTPLPVTHYFFE